MQKMIWPSTLFPGQRNFFFPDLASSSLRDDYSSESYSMDLQYMWRTLAKPSRWDACFGASAAELKA